MNDKPLAVSEETVQKWNSDFSENHEERGCSLFITLIQQRRVTHYCVVERIESVRYIDLNVVLRNYLFKISNSEASVSEFLENLEEMFL